MPPAIASDSRTISADEKVGVLDQRPRRRQGVAAARAGRQDAVARLDHVARAGQEQAVPRIDHDQHGLQPPQHPVGAPELGQLGRGARHVVGIILELPLEPLEQREPVGRRAREPDQHLAVQQLADLDRVGLHDLGAERDLAVAADGHPVPLANRKDRRRMPVQGSLLRSIADSTARPPLITDI